MVYNIADVIDDKELNLRLEKKELMSDLRTEIFELRKTIYRMKAMNTWKVNHIQSCLTTKVGVITVSSIMNVNLLTVFVEYKSETSPF